MKNTNTPARVLVNILHQDGSWTDNVSIKGRNAKDATKRLRAYLRSINAEQPAAIVPCAQAERKDSK